jgi:voltage-gated potassium channel Kch
MLGWQNYFRHLAKILRESAKVSFIIFHYIISRLVTLLKVIDAPIQVPNVFYLTVSF